jgi:capsular polysaccharide export protein
MDEAAGRVFLFLQGPHGPVFRQLAAKLTVAGAEVRRITFNPGDEAEWAGAGPLVRYLGPPAAYPEWLAHQLAIHRVTDIVLYGDSRPEHARAIEVARSRGVLCHCLEEGYLRPHCVTYERWGNNGNSPLHGISLACMAEAIGPAAPPPEGPHDGWGAHWPHLWHSALYHARLLLPSRRYGHHRSHRDLTLWREFGKSTPSPAAPRWRTSWSSSRTPSRTGASDWAGSSPARPNGWVWQGGCCSSTAGRP